MSVSAGNFSVIPLLHSDADEMEASEEIRRVEGKFSLSSANG